MFDDTSSDYSNSNASSTFENTQSNHDTISSTISLENVRLVSREGDFFELSAAACRLSQFINNKMEENTVMTDFEIQEISVNISSRILAEVVHFLLHFMVEALNEIIRVSL